MQSLIYLVFCTSEVHSYPMGPMAEFAKFIFRHLVIVGEPRGMHPLCGTAADEFPFTHPYTYVLTVAYSFSV